MLSDQVTEEISGIHIKQIYRPQDISVLDYERDLGDPGVFPFTRGKHPKMYSERPWITRVLAGEGNPRDTNKRLKALISGGQTAIDIVADTPSQIFLDPDHPLALRVVGTQGASLCCLGDYRELLDGIPIEKVSVSQSVAHPLAISGLAALAEERNIPLSKIRGSVIPYPLYGEHCAYHTGQPLEMRLRMSRDTVHFGVEYMPDFYPLAEDTYYVSEVGLSPVEEAAIGLYEIEAIYDEVLKLGVDIDKIGPRTMILMNCGIRFFEEIAKFRAFRRIWARRIRDKYGAKNPRSWAITMSVHTSGLSLTAKAPVNNISRGAFQALAAVLGGCQAVEISCFDEPYRTPTLESGIVAIRTQQIILYETGIPAVADPLGGSYFIEAVTNETEKGILELLGRMEKRGAASRLCETGYFETMFDSATNRHTQQIQKNHRNIIGVNMFNEPSPDDKLLADLAETKIEANYEQVEKIKEYKAKRKQSVIADAMNDVYENARNRSVPLIPIWIKALREGLTLEEITGAIRLSYGVDYDQFSMREAKGILVGK